MVEYNIVHRTDYEYADPVAISHHLAILKPDSDNLQKCHSFTLNTTPLCEDLRERRDYFGNSFHLFSVPQPHRQLSVLAQSNVTVNCHDPASTNEVSLSEYRKWFRDFAPLSAMEFLYPTKMTYPTEQVAEFVRNKVGQPFGLLETVGNLNNAIYSTFSFDAEATSIGTSVHEFMNIGRGVCQDFTHLMLTALRLSGIPACYCSGYVRSYSENSHSIVGGDASHAWVAIYHPEDGWIEYDPTNNLRVSFEHIRIARGRDFSDVSPLSGALRGGRRHEPIVDVRVTPV